MAKTSCKKGQYYCNTDQKCKPIPDGYKVRKDGILVSDDKKMTYKKKKKMKEEFVSLPLQLEVPQNDGEFKLGLMFRESLEQDRGMLFIFENNDYHTFHMKNTFIPLDIAFIKEDGTIDSIEELDPMNPIPVSPRSEIRYAVEVNRGWFAENDVNVGDVLLEEEPKKSLSDRSFKKLEKRARNFKLDSQEDQDQYALEVNRRMTKTGTGGYTLNRKTDQKNRRGRTVGHNKGIKQEHYDWRSTLDEKSNIEKNLHTRGGKTTPEPNTTQTAIKKVGQKLKDKFYQEENEIVERTVLQQRQSNPGRLRAQQMARERIGSGTARNPETTIAQSQQRNMDAVRARATQNNQKFQQNRQQGTTSGGQQQAARKPGFLNRVKSRLGAIKQGVGNVVKSGVSGVKRVAGGVADAATGNLTDFDKRGGKPQGLSRVVAGGIDKLTGDRTDLDKRGPSKGAPQRAQSSPQQGGKQQQQPVKKMGATEIANRERLGNDRVDALKAKNQEFQAAKKSGNLAQYRKDNPKLSGKERAQAMAKARIAAKNSAQGSQSF